MTTARSSARSMARIAWALLLVSCTGNVGAGFGPGGTDATADVVDENGGSSIGSATANGRFSELPMDKQAAKIKTLLTSDVLTAQELAQAQNEDLGPLVDAWMKTPAYQAKILNFLGVALQQSQVTYSDFDDQGFQIGPMNNTTTKWPLLLANLRESMARTVLQNDADKKSFKENITGHTFMMTTPLVVFYAYRDRVLTNDRGNKTNGNGTASIDSLLSKYTAADYANWRPVTVRLPNGNEATTLPTDAGVASLNTLVLKIPRTGFMTTPAFFAQWRTNTGNVARVTLNQTLVVAVGHVIDGSTSTPPLSLAAIDTKHAAPNTPCYSCHLTLDPMRQFFRNTYSLNFSPQTDPVQMAMPGQFDFLGVNVQGTGFDDLARNLADHPEMPKAWAKKVCEYASDGACLATDPELMRIADNFAASGSFSGLVKDTFTSPLVTYAKVTETTKQQGVNFSVTKSDHLCPLLSQRLGMPDVCGLAADAAPSGNMATVQTIAKILPGYTFSRGTVVPPQANDPTLFFRSGAETMCSLLAYQLVDRTGGGTSYSSSDPNASIASMVHGLMGVPAANDATPIALLTAHYQAAAAISGMAAKDALASTFTVACTSPSVMGIAE